MCPWGIGEGEDERVSAVARRAKAAGVNVPDDGALCSLGTPAQAAKKPGLGTRAGRCVGMESGGDVSSTLGLPLCMGP